MAPPAPVRPTAFYPNTAPQTLSIVYAAPYFCGPSSNVIGNASFPGYGADGAATFTLSLEPGTKVTYSWGTDIFTSYSGLEQRCNTTGPRPRQRFEGSAFLVDSSSRDLRGALQRAAAAGSTFLLALPHEELLASADSVGATMTVSSTALADWAIVTQRVLVWGVDNTTKVGVIQAVTPTTIRLDVTPGATGRAGARIMPLVQVLLDSAQGFSRYAVNVDIWSIRCMANVFGWVGQDVMGRGVQLTTYTANAPVDVSTITEDDLLVWDRPNLIEGTANESMLSLAEVVDLGALPFGIGGADTPHWARPIKYSSPSMAEWQWFKAFIRQTLGRQKSFLLPTNRDDLVFVSKVSTTLVVQSSTTSGAGDYTSWYTSQAHRRLALTKSDGSVQYVTVTSLTDNGSTLSLTVDTPIVGTVTKVSFLEQVRFDNNGSDDFAVTWDGATFSVDLVARTTEEVIATPARPQPPQLFLLIGDSIQVGIGVGDQAKQDDPSIGTPITSVKYLTSYANGVGPPPTFLYYPSAGTLGSLNLYAASSGQSMGFEMTMGPLLAASLSSQPVLVKRAVSGSTLATEWAPDGTYPAAGSGNLYHLAIADAQAMADQAGAVIAGVFIVLGTNDAISGTNAANFQTNVESFDARLAADLPGCKRVYLQVNSATGTGSVPISGVNVTTVRNGLVAGITDTLNAAIVNYDPYALLADGLHPTTETYLGVGPALASAMLGLLGTAFSPLLKLGTTGWGVSWGPGTSGTGSITPHSYGAGRTGGRELLVVTTGIVSGTIPTPSSSDAWTRIGSTIASTASGVTEQMAIFTRAWSSAATTVSPTTTARHMAKCFYVEGPNFPTAPTISASQATTPGTFGTGPTTFTAVSMPTNGLALLFPGGYCGSDPTISATNSTLANYTKATNSSFVIITDREVVACFAGTGSGTSGTWSESSSASMVTLGFAVSLAG